MNNEMIDIVYNRDCGVFIVPKTIILACDLCESDMKYSWNIR